MPEQREKNMRSACQTEEELFNRYYAIHPHHKESTVFVFQISYSTIIQMYTKKDELYMRSIQ